MDKNDFEEFKSDLADIVHRDYGLPIGTKFDRDGFNKTVEMVTCSNLLCSPDITEDDLIDIVKYSIVVIDAEKYLLDWKKAASDFKIAEKVVKYLPQS